MTCCILCWSSLVNDANVLLHMRLIIRTILMILLHSPHSASHVLLVCHIQQSQYLHTLMFSFIYIIYSFDNFCLRPQIPVFEKKVTENISRYFDAPAQIIAVRCEVLTMAMWPRNGSVRKCKWTGLWDLSSGWLLTRSQHQRAGLLIHGEILECHGTLCLDCQSEI